MLVSFVLPFFSTFRILSTLHLPLSWLQQAVVALQAVLLPQKLKLSSGKWAGLGLSYLLNKSSCGEWWWCASLCPAAGIAQVQRALITPPDTWLPRFHGAEYVSISVKWGLSSPLQRKGSWSRWGSCMLSHTANALAVQKEVSRYVRLYLSSRIALFPPDYCSLWVVSVCSWAGNISGQSVFLLCFFPLRPILTLLIDPLKRLVKEMDGFSPKHLPCMSLTCLLSNPRQKQNTANNTPKWTAPQRAQKS